MEVDGPFTFGRFEFSVYFIIESKAVHYFMIFITISPAVVRFGYHIKDAYANVDEEHFRIIKSFSLRSLF